MQHLLILNDFGTGEIIFIMLVVLIMFGSKNIPSIAKTLGKGMREIRNASDEIKRDITSSVNNMKRDMNMDDHLKSIQDPIRQIEKSIIEDPAKPLKKEKAKQDQETINSIKEVE